VETPPGICELARGAAASAESASSRGGGFHDCRELQGGSELHALAEEAREAWGERKR